MKFTQIYPEWAQSSYRSLTREIIQSRQDQKQQQQQQQQRQQQQQLQQLQQLGTP